jgi:hypothetical protein
MTHAVLKYGRSSCTAPALKVRFASRSINWLYATLLLRYSLSAPIEY